MLSIQEIREDLREIRYYYSKQKMFDSATKVIASALLDKVERYNQAMKNASARLYDLYYSLYVQNNTQAALAYDWDLSVDYLKLLNRQLCEFLQKALPD